MAKKQNSGAGDDILLNINVTGREDLQGARDDAKGLKNELDKTGNADLGKGVKSLKGQLLEAKLEAQRLFAAGKQNTEEYANAARKVQSLKNDIDELNNTFKAFDPDNKFRVFSNAAAAGAKAVQGYAGAMAFLGVNSEDATQTIAKLQGIMAFADAIDSLNDLKDSYNDLLRMLGLTTTATQTQAAAQVETAVAAEASTAIQVASEEQLAALRLRIAEADLAASESLIAMDLEGIATIEEYFAAETAYNEAIAARIALTAELGALEAGLAAQTDASATASEAAAGATDAITEAQDGASKASFTLGGALKAIGIGLIISLIAYLITNWKEVKKVIVDLFPALKDTGELFDKFKQIVFGVGNAILQFIVAPIKAIIKVIQGDFRAALGELAKGADFVKNFEAGASKEAAAQAEARRVERVKNEIEANERIIKERKALGENTLALEVANKKRAISILDKEDEEYSKNLTELQSDITVMQNAEWKKQSDAYKAKLKEDLDRIRANVAENLKIVQQAGKSQRQVEQGELDIKFAAELEILNKRRNENKKYNEDLKTLLTARKIAEQAIAKKYDDAFQSYQDSINSNFIDAYDKRETEIKKRTEEALKNATNAQKGLILAQQARALGLNKDESIAAAASGNANVALTNAENSNRPSDGDTADQARNKISNLASARREAENAAFELKKLQLEGQYSALEQLQADHEKALTDIDLEQSNARKEIAQIEAENRLKLFDAIASGASTMSDLLGESTLAGKALAVAAASISTYAAIAGQLQAFSKIPIPGYAIAQAIATGLVGLANVKKILTVKVPAKSGGGSAGGGGTAPVINSTVLSQDKSGSTDVKNAIDDQNKNQKPLRAFIVNKDLDDQKERTDYYNSQSTY